MADLQGGIVVFIHGVLMSGRIMSRLQARIEYAGWQTAVFDYPSRSQTVAENAAALADFLKQFDGQPIYLVAHSSGGRVCLRCLQDHPELKVRRFVAIGTPFFASAVAQTLSRYRLGRWLLGQSIGEDGLTTDCADWQGETGIGVIAGSNRIGVSNCTDRFSRPLARPHDGTVTVASTRLPGISDHTTEHHSHTLLLYSEYVAIQVIHFIDFGFFKHDECLSALNSP